MSAELECVWKSVRAGGLLAPGRAVVVMFSGGRDSTCLLDAALTLSRGGAGATPQSGAHTISALHVNHGLRADAERDEEHCRTMCRQLGVPLEVVRAPERPTSGNLHAWARDLRYRAGISEASRRDALLAVGHTASDQAETILYRLAASPGRRALLGMVARRGDIVRPLLDITRDETAAYCRARGLPWLEDPSNLSPDYARTRVRDGLLPALRAVHPAAEASVLRTAQILRSEAEVLDELVADALGSDDRISLGQLGSLRPALARLVLDRLAEGAAPGSGPNAGNRLTDVLALGSKGGTSAIDIGDGLRAVVEYGVLSIRTTVAPPTSATVVLPVPGRVTFGAWDLVCAAIDRPDQADLGDFQRADGSRRAFLDLESIGHTLTVRAWRAGDRMRPLGLQGSKALSDLFTERRVPRERRGSVPVISAASEIVWVPGVAIADSVKIHPGSGCAAEVVARPLGAGSSPV